MHREDMEIHLDKKSMYIAKLEAVGAAPTEAEKVMSLLEGSHSRRLITRLIWFLLSTIP